MKNAPRLFVDAPLAAGAAVALTAGQAHYLKSVLRLAPGERLRLFNGRDGEWLADLTELSKSGGAASAVLQTRAQASEPDLWLLFAPIKGDRIDTVAEKATELGVARLQPVLTRRTVVGRVNVARLKARAIEAAEQSERLTMPEVMEPRPLQDVFRDWPSGRRLYVCAESGAARPIGAVLSTSGPRVPCGLLIGPEGGFSPDELDLLSELPFVTAVGLGPRVLRADTAAIAALAVWQALLGDGDRRPPSRLDT